LGPGGLGVLVRRGLAGLLGLLGLLVRGLCDADLFGELGRHLLQLAKDFLHVGLGHSVQRVVLRSRIALAGLFSGSHQPPPFARETAVTDRQRNHRPRNAAHSGTSLKLEDSGADSAVVRCACFERGAWDGQRARPSCRGGCLNYRAEPGRNDGPHNGPYLLRARAAAEALACGSRRKVAEPARCSRAWPEAVDHFAAVESRIGGRPGGPSLPRSVAEALPRRATGR